MKTRFLILFTTLVGFVAGVLANQWVCRHPHPTPPPPGALTDIHGDGTREPQSPEALAKIQAEIEAYRAKVEPRRQALHAKLEAVFTPEQREKFRKQHGLALKGKHPRFGEPGWAPLALVYVTTTANRLKESLELDDAQYASVLSILKEERLSFFEFSDSNPPPSFQLNKMAPPKP